MNSLKVGYIISVIDNDKNTSGVIIDIDSTSKNIICFNIGQNGDPIFYQVDLTKASYNIDPSKYINQPEFLDLKKGLLKYYHMHKGNMDEVKVLKKIMAISYPNGIPQLQDKSNHVTEVDNLEESQLLNIGNQIKIKCYPNSTVSFLDNNVLDVIDFFPNGIRTLKRGASSESNKYYTLFYKHPPQDKTLAGIREMSILPKKMTPSLTIQDQLKMKLKNDMDKSSSFLSQIMDYNGNIYEINSDTLEINSLDKKKKGSYFPGSDEIKILVNINDSMDGMDMGTQRIVIPDTEEDDDMMTIIAPQTHTKPNVFILPETKELPISYHIEDDDTYENNLDMEEINLTKLSGGGSNAKSKTKTDSDFSLNSLDFGSLEEEELTGLGSRLEEVDYDSDDIKSKTEDSDFELEETEFDIEDEPVELSKVVYRSKKVPIPDEKKIYEPTIQKSEFFKYLLEKYIPNKQLRKNSFLINQVHKINNRIVDLKDEFVSLKKQNIELENEDVAIYNQGKKPFLDFYLKNDYRNKFLIPVVLDRKKLYFRNEVSEYQYEHYTQNSNILNKNHQQVINDLSNLIQQKDSNKISSITYFQLEKAINEMLKPYKVNDDSKMIGVIGHNTDKIPLTDLPFSDYTGLVVRFNKSPFKNQGIDFQESEIEGYNLKTPLIYYVEKFKEKTDDDIDREEDEMIMIEDVEKEWIHEESMESTLNNVPNLKKIQDGERFNIIGYLALPLKHAMNPHQIYYDSLSGLYDMYQSTTGVEEKTINLEDEMNEILKSRDKPTFYYLPENNSMTDPKEYLDKLIPDFKEICRQHAKELKESENWSQLETIIESYGYNLRYLNIEDWKLLSDMLEEQIEGQSYHLSKRWVDYMKYLQHESPQLKSSARNFPLIDKTMLENLENYYESYPALNKSVDSDTSRLAWAVQKNDHGKLLELLLIKNQTIEDEKNINRGEIDRSLAKKKQELEILEGRYKSELKMSSYYDEKAKSECRDTPQYQVAKIYQTTRDMEKDNYIIAKSNVGDMTIKVGQYCIVRESNKVYIRHELPNKTHSWEISKLKVEQLEELVKKDCQTPAFDNLKDLMNGDTCQVQKEDMKCYPAHIDRIFREIKNLRKFIAVLESELEEINKIEFKKRTIDKDISKTKAFLTSQTNLEKLEREGRLTAYRQIIDDVKKAKLKIKDCPHFQVLNYFMKMKHITPKEKYALSDMVLQKFRDHDPVFLKDILMSNTEQPVADLEEALKEYGRIDIINPTIDFNYTYCRICHQKLICNHFLFAHSIIQKTGELDENLLKDVYGIEVDQNYNCKVCGEFLVASDEIDMDGFVKKAGAGDAKMVTRELIDQDAERREVRKNIMDELLDEADSKNDEESKDMKLFLNTLQTLKSLTRVKLMTFDEEDIISFIKSQPFLSREYFKEYLRKSAGAQHLQNPQLIEYQATQFFYRFAVCDITSRFLITLQTSEMTYMISSDICKGHLGGYPLGSFDDLTTVRYFSCLLQKMGGLPEFNFLAKEQNLENRFIGRLKLMAQNQNIMIRYNQAIERKVKDIAYEDPFAKNYTNFWIGYRPCMGVLDASVVPQHIINPMSVSKVLVNKFDVFMADMRANLSYYSSKIFDNVQTIISKENPSVTFSKVIKLGNSCCMSQIKENIPSSYYDFIFSKESQMRDLIKTLSDLDYVKYKIDKRIGHIALPPSYMKVDSYYQIDPYYHTNQPFEIKQEFMDKLFQMYVESGVNIGSHRIYNSFGVCILSGQTKSEILNVEHNDGDYQELILNIQHKGKIEIEKAVDLGYKRILTLNIENYLNKNNSIEKTDFIHEFLTTLKKLINNEKEIEMEIEEMDEKETGKKDKSKKSKPKESIEYDIEKHWSKLDQAIDMEIDKFVSSISSIRKDPDLKQKLFRMGDYAKIYQEEVNNTENQGSFEEINTKRYLRIEKNLKHYMFDFFRSSLAIIKNNAFDKYRSFDMNPQWKYLVNYREYQGLFKRVFTLFNTMTQDIDLFKGSTNSYFTYQNANSLLKYVMFVILNKMISLQPEKKKSKQMQLIIKADMEDVDLTMDEKDPNMQLFNLKVFSDQKIILLYISQIIDKIMKEEEDFSQLTKTYMSTVESRKLEERNRKNLNLIKILADDGRKDLRRVLADQKRLGLIDYEDYADILEKEIAAGEDVPAFDRDMELIDELNNMDDVDGHVIEEKKRQKLLDYEIEDDEYSYVAGEDDDIEDF